jgi:hypothetical protein
MARNDPASSNHRQSMGWFADRAADVGAEVQRLPSTREEDEQEQDAATAFVPAIQVDDAAPDGVADLMADIDKTISEIRENLPC